MRRLTVFFAAFLSLLMSGAALGQTLYDSFSDGDFTSSPAWGGTTSTWTVVSDSDAAAGATGSNTLRLSVPTAVAGTEYLSSQISFWGTSQEWGFWVGRRAQAFTAANQMYIWLYANEADLTSATVDGYRLAIGDDSGNDEIRLEYIENGAVSATVITSSGAVTNAVTDIGFLVRVTRDASGNWELFTSALPTTSGTGAVATEIPNSTNASVSQGTGTNNSLVPAANGYIGVAALHSSGANPRATVEFDQVYFTPVGPTAAAAAISGRVTNFRGQGLRNITLILTGGDLDEPLYARTNNFGFYQFPEIPVGQTYVVQVMAKQFSFREPAQVVFLDGGNTVLNFTVDRRW